MMMTHFDKRTEDATHFWAVKLLKLSVQLNKQYYTGILFCLGELHVSALSFFIRYLIDCQPSSYVAEFGNSDCTEAPHLSPDYQPLCAFKMKSHCFQLLMRVFFIWRLNFSVSSLISYRGTEPIYKLQNYIREGFKRHWLLLLVCFHVIKVLFYSSDWYMMSTVQASIGAKAYKINGFIVNPVMLNKKLAVVGRHNMLPVTGLLWICAASLFVAVTFFHLFWFRGVLFWPVLSHLSQAASPGSCTRQLLVCRMSANSQQSVDSCCTSCSPSDGMAMGYSLNMPRLVFNCASGGLKSRSNPYLFFFFPTDKCACRFSA